MKRGSIFVIVAVFAIAVHTAAHAREHMDGRGLGMAGSNTAAAEGLEYNGGNPAILAVEKPFGFEVLLLSARLRMSNNSLSWGDYENYFTTGDELSGRTIDDLLGNIPDSGVRIDGFAGVKAVSFCAGSFGFGVTGTGNGFASLPKEAVELAFHGNKEVRELQFDRLEGEGWGGIAINVAGAKVLAGDSRGGSSFLSAGLNLKYIFGLAYAGIEEAEGGIETNEQFILADGVMRVRTSGGGRGFAADVGVFAGISRRWSLSLHCSNLLGGINWNCDNDMITYSFETDSLSVFDDENVDLSGRDTTQSIAGFSTDLPRTISLATAFRARANLVLTAAWRQGLDSKMGNITTPRIAFGAEYAPVSFFPLRAGLAFGGGDTCATGLGVGLHIGAWWLDIGYLNHSFDWFKSARGIDLAATTHLRF